MTRTGAPAAAAGRPRSIYLRTLTPMLALFALLLQVQAPTPVAADTAVIRLGTRAIAVLRVPLGASTPEERALAAETRINHLLEQGADTVSTETTADGVLVRLGGERAFMIVPGDVDTLTGSTLDAASLAAATQLRAGVRDDLDARSLRSLAIGAGLALLATILLFFVLRLLGRGERWLRVKIERLRGAAISPRLHRFAVVFDPRVAVPPLQLLTSVVVKALGVIACYVWAVFILNRFPWTRPWGERLGDVLLSLVSRAGHKVLQAVPGIAIAILVLLGAWLFSKGIRRLFAAVESGLITLPGLHPETAEPTRRIVTVLLWLFAVVLIYPYLPGSDSAAFKGVSVFAGLLLSLGSAGLVGQAMSGLVLMYSRSFQPGDYIQVGETAGEVLDLGLLSTRLKTPKNEWVVIPNMVVTAHGVTNYSASGRLGERLILHSAVTIGYDVPRTQVESLLLDAAQQVDGAAPRSDCWVLVRGLQDWYVEYEVNVPVQSALARTLPRLYSALHSAIYDSFAQAGVEIMSPSYFAVRDGNPTTIPPGGPPPGRPRAPGKSP